MKISYHYFFYAFRYDQGRDSSQRYLSDYEDNPSRENEEVSSYYLGTLESSKHSGLSSSSYELSQYINGAENGDAAPQPVHTYDAGKCTVKAVLSMMNWIHSVIHVLSEHVDQMPAPLKYSIPHGVVSFGPAGQLIRVTPGFSARENTSKLEIHSLEVGSKQTCRDNVIRISFCSPVLLDGSPLCVCTGHSEWDTGTAGDEKLPWAPN